jgi:energy-coupling factor transport system ATP-binding protein
MLDPVGRRETVDTIRTLNRDYGITVVLITHHMDEAAQAQRLVVMSGGKIIDDGPPKEVFQHVDTLRAAGLAVPETVSLLYELKKEGFSVPLDAISDEECAAVLADLLNTAPQHREE